MRFSSGLAIGVAIGALVGAVAMYLALERPWRGGPATAAIDAGAPDAGAPVATSKKKGKKKRGGGKRGAGGGAEVAADETIVLSAADRKLSWKGDAMQRPAAELDLGEDGEEARALSGGEIQETIDRDGGGLEKCVEAALGGAVWTGEITVQLLVDGNGRATKTRVRGPAFMHAHDLLSCVRGAAKRLGFPATGGYTVVTVPMPVEF